MKEITAAWVDELWEILNDQRNIGYIISEAGLTPVTAAEFYKPHPENLAAMMHTALYGNILEPAGHPRLPTPDGCRCGPPKARDRDHGRQYPGGKSPPGFMHPQHAAGLRTTAETSENAGNHHA